MCVNKYGTDVEGNPLTRKMMGNYGLFAIINLAISAGLYFVISKIKNVGRLAITIFMVLNLLVVISNYLLFFFV